MLYVDASALLKRYVAEPDSERAEQLLLADPLWASGRHTAIEVRRNLSRLLAGEELRAALELFAADWGRMHVIALDDVTCERAAEIAEATGARTLDALHLAAALRLGVSDVRLLTFDVRQATAARAFGMTVVGL